MSTSNDREELPKQTRSAKNAPRRIAIENVALLQEDQGRQHRRHRSGPKESRQLSTPEVLSYDEGAAAAAAAAAAAWYGATAYRPAYPNTTRTPPPGYAPVPPNYAGQPSAAQQRAVLMSNSPMAAAPYYGPPYSGYPTQQMAPPYAPKLSPTSPYAQQQPYVPWPGVQPYYAPYPPPTPAGVSSKNPTQPQGNAGNGTAAKHPLKRSPPTESDIVNTPPSVWSDGNDKAEYTALLQGTENGYGATAERRPSAPASANRTSSLPPSKAGSPARPKDAAPPALPMLDISSEQLVPLSMSPRNNNMPPPALRRSSSSEGLHKSRAARPKQRQSRHQRSQSEVMMRRQVRLPSRGGPPPSAERKREGGRHHHHRAQSWSNGLVEDPLIPGTNRARADSTGSGGRRPSKGHHRRVSSMSGSVVSSSMVTDISVLSVVTDIKRSSFFAGVNEAGFLEMDYPFSRVHLVMDKTLPSGELFQVPVDDEVYDEYQEMNMVEHGCGCSCHMCHGCTGKSDLLPPNYYVMAVDDDLYRRLFDEASASLLMPCGLFFCGHHEDVSRPSVRIPLAIMVTLICSMGVVAYVLKA